MIFNLLLIKWMLQDKQLSVLEYHTKNMEYPSALLHLHWKKGRFYFELFYFNTLRRKLS